MIFCIPCIIVLVSLYPLFTIFLIQSRNGQAFMIFYNSFLQSIIFPVINFSQYFLTTCRSGWAASYASSAPGVSSALPTGSHPLHPFLGWILNFFIQKCLKFLFLADLYVFSSPPTCSSTYLSLRSGECRFFLQKTWFPWHRMSTHFPRSTILLGWFKG